MDLNDLLIKAGHEPASVLVMRHRPVEPAFRRVLPWLAVEDPHLYNAYQRAQTAKAETALLKAKALVSFVAYPRGRALFVGLYRNDGHRPLSYEQYWAKEENRALADRGMKGFGGDRASIFWFDLVKTDFRADWSGRLVVNWPGGERSWWRWADRNIFSVDAILPANAIEQSMPDWREIVLSWSEPQSLPSTWRAAMSQWRGVYFILDQSDSRFYVGSASGAENILGRWTGYAASGHGGNKELRKRNPRNFCFSRLELVAPSMPVEEVIDRERLWKLRLSSRSHGLNEN